MLKKKIWAKNYWSFYPTNFQYALSRIYGFGIRDPEKTYSGSRIQGSKRHRIPDPQHWIFAQIICVTCIPGRCPWRGSWPAGWWSGGGSCECSPARRVFPWIAARAGSSRRRQSRRCRVRCSWKNKKPMNNSRLFKSRRIEEKKNSMEIKKQIQCLYL